jgi:hypothetical protein
MKKLFQALFLCFAVCLPGVFWLDAQQAPASTPGIVEGVVVDASTGNPIPGVGVLGPAATPARPGQVSDPTVITDDRGYFTLGSRPGRVQVSFEKSGHLRETRLYSVQSGQTANAGTVRLYREGVIFGRVLKTSGTPAVNMQVALYSHRMVDGVPRLVTVAGTPTNDRGEFRISTLRPNRYLIAFQPDILRPDGSRSLTEMARERNILGGEPRIRTSADDPLAKGNVPFLYPGVGDISRAEWIELRGGEIQLRDVITGPSRLGVVRLHLRSPGSELPKEIELGIVEAYADPGLTFAPNRTSWDVRSVRLRLDTIELVQSYWFAMIGVFEAGVRWTTPSGEQLHVTKRFEFHGNDTDVFMEIRKPEGRLDIRVVLADVGTDTRLEPFSFLRACSGGTGTIESGVCPRNSSPQLQADHPLSAMDRRSLSNAHPHSTNDSPRRFSPSGRGPDCFPRSEVHLSGDCR